MKKILLLLQLFFCSVMAAFAQTEPIQQVRDSVLTEGKRLFRSEMASWHGTDLFLEKFKDREKIGGYFSYEDAAGAACIFFSTEESPKVIGTMRFDTSFNLSKATADLKVREFTVLEKQYYQLRNAAYASIQGDTMIRQYKNTNLNLIPLIYGDHRKVYILTATTRNDLLLFGNDYLLEFDANFRATAKRRLHGSLIESPYGQKDKDGNQVVGAMHSHLPLYGDVITPTDLCTLMLYQRFTGWGQYMVVGRKYMSIWTAADNNLAVIPVPEK
ncbi:hypothetical protein LZZ85_14580 [Terrimonas sp. NA20]|uniref:Uncharacterized protein n=1 Tax=Terrimonas ginsenosidimutans TaxID=2908004 RepID=A0ABS9KTA6_9BACT|nr:hypothetical protein [Terrimonas ginsenosidimutans]MCG2615523.1 hypothetical protein [Terrimonas ginsenosidimutans]